MASINSFLLLAWITWLIFCASLCTGSCRQLVFSAFLNFANRRLVNHTINIVEVQDVDECKRLCLLEHNCVSVNLDNKANGNRRYNCELNNATHEMINGELVHVENYLYRGTQNACSNYPCQNGGTCQSGFTKKRYRCLCQPGWKGDNCTYDVDECGSSSLNNCSANEKCVNEHGSYRCENILIGLCKVCIPECHDALGVESGAISDRQMSASSQWNENHAASQGRLYLKAGSGKGGSWSAKDNNVSQWLQVDLGNPHTKVTALATQGKNNYPQWVTKYKVQYSGDGVSFQYFMEEQSSTIREFVGNTDQVTVVYHKLSHAIRARYIRFRPVAWHGHISMRVEIYGCKDNLGMENNRISDGQISASSELSPNHKANQGRLYYTTDGGKGGAWSAKTTDKNQWLQIDLGGLYATVTAVATQGRHDEDEWVTEYMLQYSNETLNFTNYREPGQTTYKIFTGNDDRDTVVLHSLSTPFKARYIRFLPTLWHGRISMRVELYGCKDWKKINNETVCYKAKNSHGGFRITKQGLIHTFKLVHRRGSLKCTQHIPATFWGCLHPVYGDQTLSTVITYENKSVLPLAEYRDGVCTKYSYKIKGIDVNSTELLFNHLPSPISVSNGQVFKIWYNQALLPNDCAQDNSGEICVDVYALYA